MLNGSLSIKVLVILGSSLTESPPNVKRVYDILQHYFHFQTYKISYIITLDFITVWQYNITIESNTNSPQVSCQFFTLPPRISK